MQAEIIAIGDELLSGSVINKNAAFLSQALFEEGVETVRHTVIQDRQHSIICGVKEALSRAQLVILTGGLGPTVDDITRESVAQALQRPLVENPEHYLNLIKILPQDPAVCHNQAQVISGAKLWNNRLGSAPGQLIDFNEKWILLLPGVPIEMEALVKEHLHAFFNEHHLRKTINLKKLLILDCLEKEVDPYLRDLQSQFLQLKCGIYPNYGFVRVVLQDAPPVLDAAYQKLHTVFGSKLHSTACGSPEELLHEKLMASKHTISFAESCTGGKMAATLTQFSGASHYFLGSFVTYSNLMKENALGVSKQLLVEKGAVSAEVARSMWEGALDRSGATLAASITGIAGPGGGSQDKPVGLVYICVGGRDENPQILEFKFRGSRTIVIEKSCRAVIRSLLDRLTGKS